MVPLVAEVGGRWHPSVPDLVRKWARAYVARCPELPEYAVGQVASRWAARLSALLIRGNALIASEALPAPGPGRAAPPAASGGLPDLCPEGESAYELLVR